MFNNFETLDGGRVTIEDIKSGNYKVNNDFYVQGSVNVGYNRSKSSSSSHNESAVVTEISKLNDNSKITYNNVNSITYQGTKASDTTFVYNDVKDVVKEGVELHNSYNSENSSFGINAGATIRYGNKAIVSGNGGSISVSNGDMSNQETKYENGNFTRVNEVHNNTGTMT